MNAVNLHTMSITIGVNTSPLAGTEGTKLTGRMIRERLNEEAMVNADICVNDTDSSESFEVYGYSPSQLIVLIENMRREGFELTVSKPQILLRRSNDNSKRLLEPYYEVITDTPTDLAGVVIEALNKRKGNVIEMFDFGVDTTRIINHIALRFLLSFKEEYAVITRGLGVLSQSYLKYDEVQKEDFCEERKGSLISIDKGQALPYALSKLQDVAIHVYIQPHDEVYPGMIVGENNRDEDLEVPLKNTKMLANMRSGGDSETFNLVPNKSMTLEDMIGYINHDECIEATPLHLRMRKILFKPVTKRSKMKVTSNYSFKVLES